MYLQVCITSVRTPRSNISGIWWHLRAVLLPVPLVFCSPEGREGLGAGELSPCLQGWCSLHVAAQARQENVTSSFTRQQQCFFFFFPNIQQLNTLPCTSLITSGLYFPLCTTSVSRDLCCITHTCMHTHLHLLKKILLELHQLKNILVLQ